MWFMLLSNSSKATVNKMGTTWGSDSCYLLNVYNKLLALTQMALILLGCHLFDISGWSGASYILWCFESIGKNWDFTAALSDFEQLRQVHAGNLTYSSTEDRPYPPPDKEMARVGRPLLHRQNEVVQGEFINRSIIHNIVLHRCR